jgi:isopenicillin N synthase-like dioxygenase
MTVAVQTSQSEQQENFCVSVPIIDLAPLLSNDLAQERDVAAKIGQACRDTGFFYIINHGVSLSLVKDMFDASAALFRAPPEIKEEVAYAGASANRGYITVAGERLERGRPPDLKESFNVGLELSHDDPDLLAGRPFRHANLWPKIQGFRETTLAYFDEMLSLGRTLHRAFALDLGLSANFFDDRLRKPMATLRMLHYPAGPAQDSEGQIGAGVHTDYGNVTLLATDEVGGLKVQHRSGQWLDAPAIPGAFVCNIGDCLMRWTNDVYQSTPHKVETPAFKERFSIAFFVDPDPEAVVSCLPGCVTEAAHPKYLDVLAEDFLLSRIAPTYQNLRG